MRNIGIHVVIAFLFCILTCIGAWGQSTAQVSGAVKDQTGAVLPGTEVTMTQTETGLKRTTVTDETGSYSLPNLPIGPYRLEASLPGFRLFAQTGIVLQVNSNPAINIVLQVGQVSDEVEVQANAALVETRSTAVGQVMEYVRILELPLNGRQVTDLIVLSGAAVGGGAQATGTATSGRNYPTDSISVGGGLNNGLVYILDGGTHNDPYNNLNLPLPFPDALQEFKVETSALQAQYGQHSSAAVNAVTKSGTNEFHGDLFEFVRNGSMNARNAFAPKRDSLKRNQFGGVLGGPLIKNKLFFFGADQSTTLRSAPIEGIAFVPTPAMLAGDWTAITTPACNAGRPITLRTPFLNNRIDPSLFAPAALNLVKRLPNAADSCGRVTYGQIIKSNEHVIVGKVDYQDGKKHSLFGRYEFARFDAPSPYDGTSTLSLLEGDKKVRAQSFVLGDTYVWSARIVNSFHATALRTLGEKSVHDFYNLSDLGVKNFYYAPGLPKILILSVTGAFAAGNQAATPGWSNNTVFQAADDVSWIRGAHQIGFGANYIHSMLNVLSVSTAVGSVAFTAANTGLSMGDFILGKMNTFTQQNITTHYPRQDYLGMYFQDTWKTSSRLTVNAGVRWEPFLGQRDKQGRMLHFQNDWFDQGRRSTVFKNAPAGLLFPGDAGVPNDKFAPNAWLHFAPRLGFAWDPQGDGQMTIRAAYGIFFDYPHLYQFTSLRDGPPFGTRVILTNPVGTFDDPWQGYSGGNPFPLKPVGPDTGFLSNAVVTNLPLNLKMPYINQWNLSIQRQIGKDWLIAGNYIGSTGIHVLNSNEGNPAVYIPGSSCLINGTPFTPCSSTNNTIQRRALNLKNQDQGRFYSNVVNADDGGTRRYNALLLSVYRRVSNGLTVQGNYTLSHCIDQGQTTIVQNNGGQIPGRRGLNQGNCDLDRRHIFNLSTVYATPQFSNGTLRILGTGWKISGIVRVLSGSALTVASGLDNALSGTTDQQPNQVLASPYSAKQSAASWLNPAAFVQPPTGTYGAMGPRNVRGPKSVRMDMGLARAFQVREKQSVEFRAEAFNVPNLVNLGNPTVNFTSATFGQILSASDPRILQLALKYVF